MSTELKYKHDIEQTKEGPVPFFTSCVRENTYVSTLVDLTGGVGMTEAKMRPTNTNLDVNPFLLPYPLVHIWEFEGYLGHAQEMDRLRRDPVSGSPCLHARGTTTLTQTSARTFSASAIFPLIHLPLTHYFYLFC